MSSTVLVRRQNQGSKSSSSSFERYQLQVRHKQDWRRGFILLLPQTAALPESDAASGVIKPESSFVIQNRQTTCSMWCPMYRARCYNMVCGLLRGAKYEPVVEEADLVYATPEYAFVRFKNGHDSAVSLKDIASLHDFVKYIRTTIL